MVRGLLYVVIGCLLTVGSPASAQSLKERKEIKEGEKELTEKLDEINKTCGTKLTAEVNTKSFVGKLEGNVNFSSPHRWCGNILDGIRRVCEDKAGKEAVQQKVSKVECHFDAKATRDQVKHYGPIFTLKKKVLSSGYNFKTANISDATKEYLENNL